MKVDVWLAAIVSGVISGLAGGAVGATITLKRMTVSQSSKGKRSPNVVSGGDTRMKNG